MFCPDSEQEVQTDCTSTNLVTPDLDVWSINPIDSFYRPHAGTTDPLTQWHIKPDSGPQTHCLLL